MDGMVGSRMDRRGDMSYNVQPASEGEGSMFRRIRALKMSISNALCARFECRARPKYFASNEMSCLFA